MSLFHDSALVGASGSSGAAGYEIERSLRFNSSDSAYLSRTPSSSGNRRTWTWAGWVKRSSSSAGGTHGLFLAGANPDRWTIQLLEDLIYVGGSIGGVDRNIAWAGVLRDFSAWYHIVVACDTTQSVSTDRFKVYLNGTQITTYVNSTGIPAQNTDLPINNTVAHQIGNDNASGGRYFNGYLADVHFIDGQALTPSSFTEVSATTGQLIPKAYTGTYGTNGFRLDFSNPLDLGNDAAGTNDWTPNNLSGVSGGPTSVAAASGALPIYNTTDTYGTTKGTGTRTDSNSSSIVLAIPMDGANNGTTFTDESATIRGNGSAKSITRFGDTKTSTAQSKYYGSSGFFDGSGDYLTLASSADLTFEGDFTVEFWYFRSGAGGPDWQSLFQTENWSGTGANIIWTAAGNDFNCSVRNTTVYSTASALSVISTNTWNHFALTRSGNVCRFFINGILRGTNTISGTVTSGSVAVGYGFNSFGVNYAQGYFQDVRAYKGVAKYTSNFNPPSSTQNPTVAAGNDSLVDTPTSYGTDDSLGGSVRGNYCILNPLTTNGTITVSNGNLDITTGSADASLLGSIAIPASGKWYFEATLTNTASQTFLMYAGVKSKTGGINTGAALSDGAVTCTTSSAAAVVYPAGTSNWSGGWTNNDVLGVAINMDANTITFYKNNTAFGTSPTLPTGTTLFPYFGTGNSGVSVVANFGARSWAYQAPAGFKALCDTNLPAPVVAKPSTAMDVKLYTGNGSTQTISGLGFSPDLTWIKQRNGGGFHSVYDIVRTAGKALYTNSTTAEETNDANGYLSAFTGDGFTVVNQGLGLSTNGSGNSYVAWTWDAGTTTSSNGSGSITSQVRANASAGFSVITYTGNGGTNATVGHGLGVAPQLVIGKWRGGSSDWEVYHKAAGATKVLQLNATNAAGTLGHFGSTDPTSSVITVNASGTGNEINGNGQSYVLYAFSPVAGYSNFGSYVGNGSADGPFVYTGFRPRWILIKNASATGNWVLQDTARSTKNIATEYLLPDMSAAEGNSDIMDILSNGFKQRNTFASNNSSGATYIYAAFAESPFAYSRAR